MDLQFGLAVAVVIAVGFLLANRAGAGPIIWAEHSVASQRSVMLSDPSSALQRTILRMALPQR